MDFSEVLSGLGRPAPEESGSARKGRGADVEITRILEGFGRSAGVNAANSRAAYRQNAGAPAEERPAVATPPAAEDEAARDSLDPDDIAFELALDAATSLEDLALARRLFARANHPDRVPAARRALATQRMTIANALVDAASARFARR